MSRTDYRIESYRSVRQGIGNSNSIGVEAENTGRNDGSPWPDAPIDAYRRGVAAISKHIGRGARVRHPCKHPAHAAAPESSPDARHHPPADSNAPPAEVPLRVPCRFAAG